MPLPRTRSFFLTRQSSSKRHECITSNQGVCLSPICLFQTNPQTPNLTLNLKKAHLVLFVPSAT